MQNPSKRREKDVLVLLSGGIDSTACIHYYSNLGFSVNALFIDYNQKSKYQEFLSAKNVASHYGIKLKRVSVTNLNKMSSGLINGRNLFLLSIALLCFKNKGLIALGVHFGTQYNDCKHTFIEAIQKVFDIYNNGTIRIDTPFIKMTKNEIWNFCQKNNVPINLTYSCENGEKQPCGRCNSCKDLLLLYESSK